MLQRIYSASEHWWTCCKQKSPTMQKLPSPYAGCKKQAFREGSCILFCASQTTFGEHLFIWRLEGFVQCSFFSIFWMLLKWSFPPPWSSLRAHWRKTHLDISAPSICWEDKRLKTQDSSTFGKGNGEGWKGFKSSLSMHGLSKPPRRWLYHCQHIPSLLPQTGPPPPQDGILTVAPTPATRSSLTSPRPRRQRALDSTAGFEVTHVLRCQHSDWGTNPVTDTQSSVSLNYVNRNIFR